MSRPNRTTRTLSAIIAVPMLCAALVAGSAMAASPKLESIAVTPVAKEISVGQRQLFVATGMFSNGSRQRLGPAYRNIAAGFRTTCAVLTSGGVECWGSNSRGQLGDGTTSDSLVPRRVKGIKSATAVALGSFHACALLASGRVSCWGANYSGQLGNGSGAPEYHTPLAVSGITTATAIAAGHEFTCALLESGAVACWGEGSFGQLGNGAWAGSGSPVSVAGISTATGLALGSEHACVTLASGTVRCWGNNVAGGLGNGTRRFSNVPVTVTGINNAVAVAAGSRGGYSSCALLAIGTVQCWGDNRYGQLGNGSSVDDSPVPVPVTGIDTAKAISAGHLHHCAVLRSGSVKCWGASSADAGPIAYSPVRVVGINSPTRLVSGFDYNCALFPGGMVRCWGSNDFGQLGNRRIRHAEGLVTVVGTPGVVWTSSRPSTASINDRGVATGRGVGNATITATTPGLINDNAVLTVQ